MAGHGREAKRASTKIPTPPTEKRSQQSRNEKARSSPAYPAQRRGSTHKATAHAESSNDIAAPTSKGRAYSVPIAPTGQLLAAGASDGAGSTSGEVVDEEIAVDPFFLRYNTSQTATGHNPAEEPRSAPSSEFSSDGEGNVVPKSHLGLGSPPQTPKSTSHVSFFFSIG
jgi:hypothetical protein